MGASCVMKSEHFIFASEVETQHNLKKHEIHYLGPQKAIAQVSANVAIYSACIAVTWGPCDLPRRDTYLNRPRRISQGKEGWEKDILSSIS